MPTGVYRCPEEREMRGKGNGFPHSHSAPSLRWEEGKFTTFPHMRLTSISRGVRQEAREVVRGIAAVPLETSELCSPEVGKFLS